MNPMISIIVPVYNVEKYVSDCIESILAQTYGEFELILVDDGSKDNSGIICDKYVALDKRIRVIHQNNKGPSAARNRGVDEAKGKYLSFVDSDDCISSVFCETMRRMIEETDADFSVCQFHKFQNHEVINNITEYKDAYTFISNRDYLNKQLGSGFSACAKMYRREIFEKNRFCEGKIHEDIIWSADLAKSLKNGVCYTDEKLYFYRQNGSSIMGNSRKRCHPDRVYAGEYLINMVKDNFPDIFEKAFKYGIMFPWSYVDGIYVHRTFYENRIFLKELQKVLRDNRFFLKCNHFNFSKIEKNRLLIFSYSLLLYGCNAYARLFRLYLYKIIGKDAYKDGHGI